ncbi:MAG: nitroreductase family protein [Acidimicrobiia bacterium]
MEFADVVRARRSIRRFSDEPVNPAVVDHLVDVARRAPTAGFSQGVDFLVLDDPGTLARFWALTGGDADPDGPPVLVLVFSDPERYLERYRAPDKIEFGLGEAGAWPVRFWDVDAAMAAMQLQLAAVDAGLGTWFFGIGEGEDAVRAEFGVPSDRSHIGIVAIGHRHPEEEPIGSATTRRRRPLDDQLHRNGW